MPPSLFSCSFPQVEKISLHPASRSRQAFTSPCIPGLHQEGHCPASTQRGDYTEEDPERSVSEMRAGSLARLAFLIRTPCSLPGAKSQPLLLMFLEKLPGTSLAKSAGPWRKGVHRPPPFPHTYIQEVCRSEFLWGSRTTPSTLWIFLTLGNVSGREQGSLRVQLKNRPRNMGHEDAQGRG